jgi:hypothetical protein
LNFSPARLDARQAANALWHDYQRGGRHDKPGFLKDFLPADKTVIPLPGTKATLAMTANKLLINSLRFSFMRQIYWSDIFRTDYGTKRQRPVRKYHHHDIAGAHCLLGGRVGGLFVSLADASLAGIFPAGKSRLPQTSRAKSSPKPVLLVIQVLDIKSIPAASPHF